MNKLCIDLILMQILIPNISLLVTVTFVLSYTQRLGLVIDKVDSNCYLLFYRWTLKLDNGQTAECK